MDADTKKLLFLIFGRQNGRRGGRRGYPRHRGYHNRPNAPYLPYGQPHPPYGQGPYGYYHHYGYAPPYGYPYGYCPPYGYSEPHGQPYPSNHPAMPPPPPHTSNAQGTEQALQRGDDPPAQNVAEESNTNK